MNAYRSSMRSSNVRCRILAAAAAAVVTTATVVAGFAAIAAAPRPALAQAAGAPLRITSVTPSGTNVPVGREIVIQFDRPVVPLGRMDRSADEIPIEITPALDCQWRWLDASALACQLGDDGRFMRATRYSLVVRPGITALDGTTLAAEHRHAFVTERPGLQFAGFDTWRAPGLPVLRAVFNQPVAESSVREHVFVRLLENGGRRVAVDVSPDENARELERFVRLPGERVFVDFGPRSPERPDDQPTPVDGEEARRIWLVQPVEELPPDMRAALVVEPGLEPAEGTETGDERRAVVEFYTFPELEYLGVSCRTNADQSVLIPPGEPSGTRACNPMQQVGLTFSAPVLGSEIAEHVTIVPDLAGGRADYDPWANRRDFSQLRSPHQRGRRYTVWLPERLQAAATYRLTTSSTAGPRDEFGRALAAPIDHSFATDHRPPAYTLVHPQAVLEAGIDSEVPLYVTNLDSYTLSYRTLTSSGLATGRSRTVALPELEDVQFGVPLDVRELLGGEPGALYATLTTTPAVMPRRSRESVFAAVTPYQLHAKLGHFNTLVWVTELATGRPVRNADVSVYVDRISSLTATPTPLGTARTDGDGIAILPGASTLDPELTLTGYCRSDQQDDCPRLFVRADGPAGFALLPLDQRFEVYSYRASNYQVYAQGRPVLEHLHAWGATAQGVYRAGDTIDYKIYVRNQDNETYVGAPRGPYKLEIVDPMGQVVETRDDVELSDFGAFSGQYPIPENATVGWYSFHLVYEHESRTIDRFPLRVLVSDFTPSPFRVSTTLEGDLFEAGDEVGVELRSELFSGGPYADAEARMTATLTARPFVSTHPVAAPFNFVNEFAPRELRIAQTMGSVDAQGELAERFTLPADLGERVVYGVLSVEGAVRDDRGRYVASAARANFVAVDRLVGLRTTRWTYREDEPAEVRWIVVDGRGVPAAGSDVSIAIERLETKAARVRGAGNAYLTQFTEEWLPAGSCEGRSAENASACTFVPEAPGSYRLIATVHDTQGRTHTSMIRTWVTGSGSVVWSSQNDDALELVPEKAQYEVGETARYLVKNPYPGAQALVTIERYGTLAQWVETLEGSTPIIEFEVEKDFLPGFFLSVIVMSPRVDSPPPAVGELDLGKPAFKIGYLEVPVADPYKRIDVEVTTAQEVYKPRDKVRVQIAAAPRQRDRREPIEVAVAVLDEAVLDLVQGGAGSFDPYAGFFSLDGLDVRNYGLLTRLVGRQRIELKGANPGGDGGAAFSMRSLFKYVSYWNPSLQLDSRGRGEIELEVPDNLTGWRVLVLAATPTDRFGLGETTFRVNLPTEIRPAMPNQVTENDRFDAAFTVMNRTDAARDLNVTVAATEGVAEPVSHETVVHLEPFERTTVTVPVTAAAVPASRDVRAGRIAFEVTARDASDGDGLVHELVVNKRRVLDTAAVYGSLEDARAEEAVLFPENIRADVGALGVVLSPSVIANVDGAFRYMRDYLYECWEQVLTKGVMASHFTRLRDYLSPDLEWPEAATLPATTLARAASFQAPNGGMAYFVPRDDYVSPYLSAYTALAFSWLREDGHAIPAAVEARLLDYLDDFLKRDTAPDFYTRGMASTVRAVALAALAKRDRLTLADLERYRPYVEYMSLFGKAHYLQAAMAVPGAAAIVAEVEETILASASMSGGKIAFNEVLDDGYLRISATPLNASCAILSAVSEGAMSAGQIGLAGDAPFELVRTITAARGNRDHWENTQENMFCATALIDYAQRYESTAPSMTANVALDTEPLGTARFASVRDTAVTLERPIAPADPGTARTLTIDREGAGRLYYQAVLSYASVDEAAQAVNAGIDLRREYSVQRGDEWVLLESPMRVRRGELVRVDLYVSLPTARHFVVVDDPVPGGLEPVNRALANVSGVDADEGRYQPAGGAWWFRFSDWREYGVSRWSFYHQELRHDAARFYSEYLPAGNYHLSYTAQAIATGEFASMPTHAEEMYDPDIYGRSLPATLVVEEVP